MEGAKYMYFQNMFFKKYIITGLEMLLHDFNSNTWETKARRFLILRPAKSGLHSEF